MNIDEVIERLKKPGERQRKELGLLFHTKRHISYYVTIPFLSLPFTPNQITVIANLVQFIGILFIASCPGYFRLVGLLIFYLGDILDFVDGNVARFRDCCSKTGVFLDQLGHVIIAPCFFSAIGVAAMIDSGNVLYAYIAILLGIAPTIVSFQLIALLQFIPTMENTNPISENVKNAGVARRIIRKLVSGLFHYKAELLLLAILTGTLPELAVLFALYFPVRIFLQLLLDIKTLEKTN